MASEKFQVFESFIQFTTIFKQLITLHMLEFTIPKLKNTAIILFCIPFLHNRLLKSTGIEKFDVCNSMKHKRDGMSRMTSSTKLGAQKMVRYV